MRLLTIAACLASLVCIQFCSGSVSNAQEIRQAIRDYHTDRVFNFAPSDPWQRSNLFNTHTGHYGKFYNCDDEECKRNSPYICWKPHTENDFPPHVGFWGNLKRDLSEVRQRITDGAGPCANENCGCVKCQGTQYAPQPSGCTSCSSGVARSNGNQARPVQAQYARMSTESMPPRPPLEAFEARSSNITVPQAKFGLVQGRIVDPNLGWQRKASAQAQAQAKDSKKEGSYAWRATTGLLKKVR